MIGANQPESVKKESEVKTNNSSDGKQKLTVNLNKQMNSTHHKMIHQKMRMESSVTLTDLDNNSYLKSLTQTMEKAQKQKQKLNSRVNQFNLSPVKMMNESSHQITTPGAGTTEGNLTTKI